MSRESRVRVRVMVRVSVMTAYFFSFRSLACVGQCLVDQIIYHVTNYWCHAKLGLGLELGLVYCSFSRCSYVALFAEGKYIEFFRCISQMTEKLCHANLGLGLGLWHVRFISSVYIVLCKR